MLNVELGDGVAQSLRFEGGVRMCMFKFDVQRGGVGGCLSLYHSRSHAIYARKVCLDGWIVRHYTLPLNCFGGICECLRGGGGEGLYIYIYIPFKKHKCTFDKCN